MMKTQRSSVVLLSAAHKLSMLKEAERSHHAGEKLFRILTPAAPLWHEHDGTTLHSTAVRMKWEFSVMGICGWVLFSQCLPGHTHTAWLQPPGLDRMPCAGTGGARSHVCHEKMCFLYLCFPSGLLSFMYRKAYRTPGRRAFLGFVQHKTDWGAVPSFPTGGDRECRRDSGGEWKRIVIPRHFLLPLNLPNGPLSGSWKEEIGRDKCFSQSHRECTLLLVGWAQTGSFGRTWHMGSGRVPFVGTGKGCPPFFLSRSLSFFSSVAWRQQKDAQPLWLRMNWQVAHQREGFWWNASRSNHSPGKMPPSSPYVGS